MGTHPSGPSLVVETGESLQDWIQRNPEALGSVVQKRFQNQLPFLFKVLSVRTALSIQSHPDKELAQKLHAERPDVYKDPNHKPEMAIALSEFEALCGFASYEEMADALHAFPELKLCIQEPTLGEFMSAQHTSQKHVLREVFTELMSSSQEVYSKAITEMVKRLNQKEVSSKTDKEKLLLKLNAQYPKDVGILAACLLNYVKLRPGEAIYLPANEPHAYIAGDLIECMATSDNVIRAGLTPKLRDTAVLCSSLSYTMGMPTVLEGVKEGNALVYRPPFEEFEVHKTELQATERHEIPSDQGPSLLLIQTGDALVTQPGQETGTRQAKAGNVFFLPANDSATIQAQEGNPPVVIWRAKVNQSVFADTRQEAAS